MTDERDPKVSQRYRGLSAEEPSCELDQAILAAAHRSVDTARAPLVVPAGRHRWYYSLAAAAVLVLAIAVTVHIEHQPADAELAVPPPAPAPEQQKVQSAAVPAPPPASAPAPMAPTAPARAPSPGVMADSVAEARKERAAGEVTANRALPGVPAPVAGYHAAISPERELERIAELRRMGRDEEADKALAEFRKRYPDYVIPEAMRARIERK